MRTNMIESMKRRKTLFAAKCIAIPKSNLTIVLQVVYQFFNTFAKRAYVAIGHSMFVGTGFQSTNGHNMNSCQIVGFECFDIIV